MDIREKLKAPFKPDEIEWRVQRAMKTARGNKAIVLAYVTARAVQDRLDDVFGIDGWMDSYRWETGNNGERNVVCTLGVWSEEKKTWISKEDGAPETNVESFKGGISDSLKRVCVKFGIGRYLYNLEESWVDVIEQRPSSGRFNYINDKKAGITGYWKVPDLPAWAIPSNANETKVAAEPPKKETKVKDKDPTSFKYRYDINGNVQGSDRIKAAFDYAKKQGAYVFNSRGDKFDACVFSNKKLSKFVRFEVNQKEEATSVGAET